MRFARWVFWIAALYGILILTPMYFSERQIAVDYPPAITHPEHFYGFLGVALAWQVMFLIIGRDPVRYRAAMIPAVLEKLSFAVAAVVLFLQNRLAPVVFAVSQIDFVLAALFVVAFLRTPAAPAYFSRSDP
jgi:hypothetical protein